MGEVLSGADLCIDEAYFGDVPDTSGISSQSLRLGLAKGTGPTAVDPESCDIWAGNTRDCEALKNSSSYAELRDSIRLTGQQVAVIARVSSANPQRLEVIAGASRLTAIREINSTEDGEKLLLLVEVREMTDDEAFRLVSGENIGRSGLSPIEQARLYRRAIDTVYVNAAALAEALGLNKSTVGRTLRILDLPPELLALIDDHRKMSAAQAESFMKDWNEPNLRPTLQLAIANHTGAPAGASAVMKAMKAAVAPTATNGLEAVRLRDGAEIGTARSTKSGAFRVDLRDLPAGNDLLAIGMAVAQAIQRLAK